MHQKLQQEIRKNCVPKFSVFLALKLTSCGLMVCIDMDTYILTEDKNFKTFWKESYAIALDSCYSFTEKKTEHGIE